MAKSNGKGPPPEREIKRWKWSPFLPPRNRVAIACVLWVLHLDGPFEATDGQAPAAVKRALIKRGGPYVAGPTQPGLHHLLSTLGANDGTTYAGCIERTVDKTLCLRLALAIPPEALPPNPYEHPDLYPVPPAKPVPEPPSNGRTEPPPPSALDPLDALAAIRGLVDEALGHGLTAAEFVTAERLAAVLAENERLREERAELEAALLARLTEIDTLRRVFGPRSRS